VIILRSHPGLPEDLVGRPLLQHRSQFERMHRTRVVSQDVPEHMQRGKRHPIGLGERRDRASFDCERRPPAPWFVNIRHPDPVAAAAPEGAMQFDGDGQVRIEVIPTPSPGEGLDQRPCVLV